MKWVVIVVFSLVAMLTIGSCGSSVGRFSVVNQSSELLDSVSITICGQNFEFSKMPPAASAKAQYRVTTDSDFSVLVVFDSGRTLRREVGYVTNGVEYNHAIVITDSEVKLTVLKIK